MLSIIIFTPIFVAIGVIFIRDNHGALAYWLSLFASILVFVLVICMGIYFDQSLSQFQFVERFVWINQFNIQYHLGIDGISYPLVLLTSLLTPIVIITSRTSPKRKYHQYFFL